MKFIVMIFILISISLSAQDTFQKTIIPQHARRYERYEIQLQLDPITQSKIHQFIVRNDSLALNPFDPKSISVEAQFIAPSGKKFNCYGFYYQPYKENTLFDRWDKDSTSYPWRIRFAPDEVGEWKVSLIYKTKNSISEFVTASFNCNNSNRKGNLTILKNGNQTNRYLTYESDSSDFFAVSNNISSGGFYSYKPSQNIRHLKGVKQLIDVGGNFTRFDMQPQAALPDWPQISNYKSKLDEMYAFDRIVDLCEANNVYFIIFRHHVELLDSKINPGGSDWSGVSWYDNPYRKLLQLATKKEYFTDSVAKEWQLNSLRYVFSRWGYSPNFSFYGYSEVDNWYKDLLKDEQVLNTDFNENEALTLFKDWFYEQKNYILDSLNEKMLFSNSFSTLPKAEKNIHFEGLFSQSDIISIHDYGTTKKVNYQNRFHALTTNHIRFNKPVILEEMGVSDNKLKIYCCTGIEYHNSVWSTVMMGGFGTGMDWWWDRGVQDFGYHLDLRLVSDFFNDIPLNKLDFSPQRWSDGRLEKRLIENFALVSKEKENVLGWVHNATYYWRNLTKDLPCLQELVDDGKLNDPCFVGEGHNLNDEGTGDYQRENFKDNYTDSLGAQPIVNKSISMNPIFKIKSLKMSNGFSKNWYKIIFYEVNSDELRTRNEYSQIISTNLFGTLKIHVPNLEITNPDFAYKIQFIGKSKKNTGVLLN